MNSLSQALVQFHFLRPQWLWAILPLLLLTLVARRSAGADSGWHKVIAAEMLAYLMPRQGSQRRWPVAAFGTLWLLTALALAGPTWEKLPTPVESRQNHLVVMLDLSLSTWATDLQPDRLTRAKQKLADLLQSRHEGYTALVAYAGDSHVVTPLTDDNATIASMIPALDPTIMPMLGSRPEQAVKQALELLHNAGALDGQLLLVTDDVTAAQADAIHSLLKGSNYHLSVIGVGTAAGGPIPIPNQGFLEDNGKTVIAKLDATHMRQLAEESGGAYADISLDDSDLKRTLKGLDQQGGFKQTDQRLNFDLWQDAGFWLVLPLLPLALWLHRRGAILALFLLVALPPRPSQAMDWSSLWKTPDQQGHAAYQAKDYEAAAKHFTDPAWQGSALYRSGHYDAAAKAFTNAANKPDAQQQDAQSFYNAGNALAHQKQYQQAVAAYEQALKLQPDFADAQYNKELVEKFLKQQQKQQQKKDQNKQDQKDQKQQDKNQQGNNQQKQQGNNQQNQDQQQQNSGQSSQNQQNQQGQGQKSQDQHQQGQQQSPQQAQKDQGQQGQNQQNDLPDQATDTQQQKSAQAQQDEQKQRQQAQQQQEPQQAQQAQADKADKNAQQAAADDSPQDKEQQQAFEQWLRRVPDDPGGLLRRKFELQYRDSGATDRQPKDQPIW